MWLLPWIYGNPLDCNRPDPQYRRPVPPYIPFHSVSSVPSELTGRIQHVGLVLSSTVPSSILQSHPVVPNMQLGSYKGLFFNLIIIPAMLSNF